MKRTRATISPEPKRPLETELQRLSDDVRVLRDVLVELVTEIQWANQNRRCEQCHWETGRRESSVERDEESDDELESDIHPMPTSPIQTPNRPQVEECVVRPIRSGGRLF